MANQQRVAVKDILLESTKWMVSTIIHIGASVHHGSSQYIITIKNLTRLWRSWKAFWFCMLLRMVNGNHIIKSQETPTTTTSPPKRSFIEKRAQFYWNISLVSCLVTILVTCFNFAQVMVFLEIISKWEVHQPAKSILQVWSTWNSWTISQRVSFAFYRARSFEKISLKLDLRTLLDIRKGLEVEFKFLDSLSQLLFW